MLNAHPGPQLLILRSMLSLSRLNSLFPKIFDNVIAYDLLFFISFQPKILATPWPTQMIRKFLNLLQALFKIKISLGYRIYLQIASIALTT